jgi:hypothetical protein
VANGSSTTVGSSAVLASTPSTESSAEPSSSSTVAPGVSRLLSCGTGLAFPPDALSGPIVPIDDSDPVIGALRDAAPSVGWPTGPLRVLARSDSLALVAEGYADDVDRGLGIAPFTKWEVAYRDGAWRYAGHGSCRLFAFIDGYLGAAWELDPTATPPEPGTTELAVLVHDQYCTSSRPERIIEPTIAYLADRVEIAITTKKPIGASVCSAVAPTRYVVTLREPLGGRQLIDSGREQMGPPDPPPWAGE